MQIVNLRRKMCPTPCSWMVSFAARASIKSTVAVFGLIMAAQGLS